METLYNTELPEPSSPHSSIISEQKDSQAQQVTKNTGLAQLKELLDEENIKDPEKIIELFVQAGLDEKLPHCAVTWDLPECLEVLVQRKNVDLNAQDRLGFTPLMRAIYFRNTEAFKLLVTSGRVNLNQRGKYDDTALNLAIIKNYQEYIQWLEANGAYLDMRYEWDRKAAKLRENRSAMNSSTESGA